MYGIRALIVCFMSLPMGCEPKAPPPPPPAPDKADKADTTASTAPPTIDGHWALEYQSATPLRIKGNPCYAVSESGSQTSATIIKKLTCGNEPWTGTMSTRWSAPPSTLIPAQPLEMAVSARAAASHGGITASIRLVAAFNRADCGGGVAGAKIVETGAATHGSTGPANSARGEGIVPGRSWGSADQGLQDRLKLSVCSDYWQAYFIYKWQEGAPATMPDQRAPQVPLPPPPDEPPSTPTRAAIWQDGWKDSGTRFSNLQGMVEWRGPDDDEGWNFAKLDQPLPVGAHIRTGENSSITLSFADMTTFVQRPDTEIVLGDPSQPESPFRLAMGNLWINIKKMVKDGSMDIEMGQAVAGGRGTIFLTSEREGRSEAAVCKGHVVFRHRATGVTFDLRDGDGAIADRTGLSRVTRGAEAICAEWARAEAEAGQPAAR